eukprot:2128490-Alexandrium_andersonii.AAC.1
MWGTLADRLLLPLEHLEVQGLAIFERESPYACPWLSLARSGKLSPCDLKSLAGNSMHLSVVGGVL